MSKKQLPTQKAKPKEQTIPTFEDFFTQFLEKRKKYFVQKLEEIEKLEKIDQSTLKADQKQKVNNKHETVERTKYFDDVKSLYFEAASKKGNLQQESSQKNTESREGVISDLVNLFSVGQAIHNFEKNSTSFEHHFNSEQMTTVQDVFNCLSNQSSVDRLEETKEKLRHYCDNEELRQSVNQFILSRKSQIETNEEVQEEKKVETSHEKQVEVKPTNQRLFAEESDEEEEEKTQQKPNMNQEKEVTEEIPLEFLRPLPIDDQKNVDEFKTQTHKNGNRNYKEKGNYPNRKDRPYPPRNQDQKEEGDGTRQNAPNQNERRERPYQPRNNDRPYQGEQNERRYQPKEQQDRPENGEKGEQNTQYRKNYNQNKEGDRNYNNKNSYQSRPQMEEDKGNRGEYRNRNDNRNYKRRDDAYENTQYQKKAENEKTN